MVGLGWVGLGNGAYMGCWFGAWTVHETECGKTRGQTTVGWSVGGTLVAQAHFSFSFSFVCTTFVLVSLIVTPWQRFFSLLFNF